MMQKIVYWTKIIKLNKKQFVEYANVSINWKEKMQIPDILSSSDVTSGLFTSHVVLLCFYFP